MRRKTYQKPHFYHREQIKQSPLEDLCFLMTFNPISQQFAAFRRHIFDKETGENTVKHPKTRLKGQKTQKHSATFAHGGKSAAFDMFFYVVQAFQHYQILVVCI